MDIFLGITSNSRQETYILLYHNHYFCCMNDWPVLLIKRHFPRCAMHMAFHPLGLSDAFGIALVTFRLAILSCHGLSSLH